ncbi:MAG: hypothetical protein IID55_00075 [Proteobacteria bacterium]|nr:hypothetical protein [Pseudomonadota bacterium]
MPEALTEGADVAEAIARAADCLEEAIAARMANREDIPEPSRNSAGEIIVMLPAVTASKAALYVATGEAAGTSNVALGHSLETEPGPVETGVSKSQATGKVRKAPTRRTLVQKTALKRKTPLKRKTALRRTPFRRKPK